MLPTLSGETKQEWAYRQVAHAIAARLLPAGHSVPSTRVLAARWGVSRGVLELAFERLIHEGYLKAEVGRGTWVNEVLPEQFLYATADTLMAPHLPLVVEPISTKVQAGQPFVARVPDTTTFDLKAWRESLIRSAKTLQNSDLSNQDPRGLLSLREEICKHLALSRAVFCVPDQVLIVGGIRHAIDLCAQVVADSGAAVAIEEPGYRSAAELFAARGNTVLPVVVDENGICVSDLHHLSARAVYVTPAHQAPTGVMLSPERRIELLHWANTRGATVIEDDYDSDFSYDAAPLPALKSQDQAGSVIFCGSFNKSLFPALRVGYIVANSTRLNALIRAHAAMGRTASVLDQLTLADFMRTNAFASHLKKVRLSYQKKRDLILHELCMAGVPKESFRGLHAGFHFVLRLPHGVSEDRLIACAAERGLVLQGVSSFYYANQPPLTPAIVIGYAALTEAQTRWNSRQLASVLKQFL
ncbi:PLP-dependent aminotransferase family protein [Lampropedia puyangensis]|nr:PLP-dependent aminotransferase family protein [Lampropedia puyangensis]